MENESKIQTQHEVEKKLEFESAVIVSGMQKHGISEEEWVAVYAEKFAELWENTNLAEKVEQALDLNPNVLNTIVNQTQDNLDTLTQ